MKNYIRYARGILALCLCLTLMPVTAFAEGLNEEPSGQEPVASETVEAGDAGSSDAGGTEINTPDEETPSGSAEAEPADSGDSDAAAGEVNGSADGAEAASDAGSGIDATGPSDPDAQADPSEEEPAAPEPKKAKSLKMSGLSLKFKSYVLIEDPLDKSCAPAKTTITGQKTSIKVSWSKEAASAPIDGYIVLRKTGSAKTYNQIAKVAKTKFTYTDKSAKKKNVLYTYTVVGYKKAGSAVRISPCASWAAGVTTKSKLKNGYKAKLSKTSADLQVGGTATLTLKYDKPKKIQSSKSFRWYSNNTEVATVKKGVVTAVAPGEATITGRLASGKDYKCKVKVVGAFKPGKPVLELDYATTSSIIIMWGKTKHATSYDVYCSKDDADKYELVGNVTKTTFKHTGLEKGHLYSYIVQARNDNGSYSALSSRSAALEQKAVKTPRKTRISGFPTKKTVKSRSTCTFTIKITAPDSRKATVQEYTGKKWVDTKTVIKLPEGIETESVEVTLPDTWWTKEKTSWRLNIPKSDGATAFTSDTLKLTTKRYYQNPKKYVQITNKISKHGLSYYTAPVLVNNASTKKDHIEAMIKTAYKYLGDPYVVCQSRAPGKGVDCSGLVMQACYGAGVDLWPCNPHRHRSPAYEYESRNIAKLGKLKTVPYSSRKRGDLIFYANGSGTVIHIAIYLGNDKIIHSSFAGVHVTGMGYKYGHVCKVKRVFN